jgi:hypothetical protein
MGLFSNMFGQTKELTKLSNAVANVKNFLDQYEKDPDVSFLIVGAWICKVGVLDLIEKNSWPPHYRVFVPINGRQTLMNMAEVQLATIGRLKNKVSSLNDSKLESGIDDILDGGDAFYELDAQIPQDMRDKICNL